MSTHTQIRNVNDSSSLSKLFDTSKSMDGKIIDEFVGSAVFYAFCIAVTAELEHHTIFESEVMVQYDRTIGPRAPDTPQYDVIRDQGISRGTHRAAAVSSALSINDS